MLVQVEGMSKSFGGLQALDNVSLEARSGEVTGVIGPNGAGKTTLLNCLSGLTPFDAGRFIVDGLSYDRISAGELIGAGITRTFQSIRLFNSLTVAEHVVLARLAYFRSRRARDGGQEKVSGGLDVLERVGLAHKANLRPEELSYGERRRLEIARGLATEPRLLLLDEPAAGSTPSEHGNLGELIKGIAAAGVAIILVEHHMDLVATVSTGVVVLNFGRVVVRGSFDEVRRHPEVISVYLGVSTP